MSQLDAIALADSLVEYAEEVQNAVKADTVNLGTIGCLDEVNVLSAKLMQYVQKRREEPR